MKISLDSNAFSDQDFIEWLHIFSEKFEISVSVIVYLEIYHWYNLRNLSRGLFEEDLEKLGVKIINLDKNHIFNISQNAITNDLRFKHHARDFIIGTHSKMVQSRLITRNTKHFSWLDTKMVMTPEELVMATSSKNQSH